MTKAEKVKVENPQPQKPVTKLKLDTSLADKKVWLVKVPNFIAQRWRPVCQQSMGGLSEDKGPELARVRITYNATQSSSEFALTLTGPGAVGIPKDYRLRAQTGDLATMHIFAEQPSRLGVEGRVDQKFDLEMIGAGSELDPAYRQLSRARHQAAATKTRTMQVIDDPRRMMRLPVSATGFNQRRAKADATQDKRVRRPKDEVETGLFRLFERQAHWKFTELFKQMDQPAVWLKEVLQGIAVMAKAGPHKDLYELRREYRVRQEEGDGESEEDGGGDEA